jgi:multiple sugar transport system ATP-binding protein
MNFLDAEIEAAGPRHAVLRLPSGDSIKVTVDASSARPGQSVTLGVRPEHFDPRAKSNVLPVTVRFVESLGSVTIAYGTLAGTETEVTVQLPGDLQVRPGETIRPGAAAQACYLFDAEGRAFRRISEASQDDQMATPLAAPMPRGLGPV